jgi:L-seryl-tRNA(Ser) seleniumtransferase
VKDTAFHYNLLMSQDLARLPAVHRVLSLAELREAAAQHGALAVRDAVRVALARAREAVVSGGAAPAAADVGRDALAALDAKRPAYPYVVNATGVLIHTNLGRAPRLAGEATGYLALEMDLDSGERGERLRPVAGRLTAYFGADAATVVTNNAAALVLLLAAHAAGREVVVSRGELVEIGGSFRLPEIMAAAGARLVEVGCTNRTRLADYEQALRPETAGILVCHRSNFAMTGFVESPELAEVVALGKRRGVAVWVDQGSGCHVDLTRFGLTAEPTVQEILAAGADAVLFSGDKLLGGPQAGILVGSRNALDPLQRHPLRRALRPDKEVLASLAATLDAFLAGRVLDVPLYRLLATEQEVLHRRAARLAAALRRAGVEARAVATRAVLGGGTTPGQSLASWGVALPGGDTLAAALRSASPPVVPRIERDRVLLDLRAAFPEQDRGLLAAVLKAAASAR